ncbi:MAG: BlaI/MecI/CopY family transcriptional regulator [Defluviitaleaceae bacterium]|nr:BlaI/MecI/CopY family transcriptional regulator [Defluviitaleaceae bacterium]
MKHNISSAEWRIMQVLWEHKKPMTSAEIVENAEAESKRSPRTIKTLLQRLVSKGFVAFTVDTTDSRIYHYAPKISEDECIGRENQDFLSLYYKGNVGGMLARFIGDSDLTSEQIKELSALLDAKKEGMS